MLKKIKVFCIVAAVMFCCVCHAEAADAKSNKPAAKRIHTPQVGQPAPDFAIPRLTFEKKSDGTTIGKVSDKKVRLSSFKGKKPVFLIFSSYT
ncbi:MAG: hypothetical protein ACYSUT_03575 [Planctomycetota bacterium]